MKSRLKKLLKRDDTFKTYKSIVKRLGVIADFDNLSKELERMHKNRKSRDLHLKSPTVDRILAAAAQGSSFRSRSVEIMITVQKAQRTLQAAIERCEVHILANYSKYMEVRSIQDRKTVAKDILKAGYYLLSDFDRLVDMSSTLVNDIDQSSWTLKHMLDGLQLLYTRENIVQTSKTSKNL